MAIGATIHTFEVQLSDMDRGVYEALSLRLARHPSETSAYLATRLLAYCLEYEEGIAFGAGGISSTEEPAVLVRDLTGRITSWIEVGAPDAQRLHFGSKLAGRCAVYTHRDPDQLLSSWRGKTIHRSDAIVVSALPREFIDAVAGRLERRNSVTLSVTEGPMYLEINGESLEAAVSRHRIG